MDNAPSCLRRPKQHDTREVVIIIRVQYGGEAPPPPPNPPHIPILMQERRVATPSRGRSRSPRSGRRPHLRGRPHQLRKSRRAKCALHWHSPEQKMPVFVSTGLGHCLSQLSQTISLLRREGEGEAQYASGHGPHT